MSKKDKFLYVFLIIVTFGLILIYWKKHLQENTKSELSISEKINFNVENLIKYLGLKENIKEVKSTNQIVKITIKDNSLVKPEEIRKLKGVSGVVNNSKQISIVVGNSAMSIKKELEKKL